MPASSNPTVPTSCERPRASAIRPMLATMAATGTYSRFIGHSRVAGTHPVDGPSRVTASTSTGA